MDIKINITNEPSAILKMNQTTAESYNVAYLKDTVIRFGFATAEIQLVIDNELTENEINMSAQIAKKLHLPVFCNLNLTLENNTLVLGPFIGIIVANKKQAVIKKLRLLNNYVKYYSKLNGVIVGFSLEDINKRSLTVEGLVYNPVDTLWETATLPLPSSILKRVQINQSWREYLHTLYGIKFFNYKTINKWTMQEMLSQFSDVKEILPPSKLYQNIEGLLKFLYEHKDIYVKPIAGNRGLGIYNILGENGSIIIRTRHDQKNVEWVFKNKNEFEAFTRKNLIKESFIMQKTLDIRVNNRTADFRVGLDKNQSGKWNINMFITRVSSDHSIVSNVASGGGHVELPLKALDHIYGMNSQDSEEMKNKLLEMALNIAEKIDKTGITLGKLALDLAIDNNRDIYLIEVNNKSPNDNIMKALDDNETFFRIKLENILYAKGLAGFPSQDSRLLKFNDSILLDKRNQIRYRITLLIHKNHHLKIRELTKSLCLKFNIVGFVIKDNSVNRLVMEVEGNDKEITNLIENIKCEFSEVKGLVISKKLIRVLNTEKSFKIVTKKQKGKNKSTTKTIKILEKRASKLNEEIKNLKQQNKKLFNENLNMKRSRSWRITSPIRKLVRKNKK